MVSAQWGTGATHAQYEQVERLVEMQIVDATTIELVDRPPLQLQLTAEWDNDGARNWEGLVRLDDLGFVVVTDRFPNTILGFVPLP